MPTLRRLLTRPELALTLLAPDSLDPEVLPAEPAVPAEGVDASVVWVHSSDLLDPTPFLAAGHLLLTTGTQFGTGDVVDDAEADARYADYVDRLQACGVVALGFGTEVVRAGTPQPLIDACRARGLPLFEVPFRIPFIAVERAAGDLIAEERYARSTWALAAQHAIALAALRPDGLGATLAELSRQLDHWVALFDASGKLDRVFPESSLAATSARGLALESLQRDAARLLSAGKRASSSVIAGGETLTLQTLGRPGALRGVLALGGTTALDRASHSVVTSVIALAGLSLEQNATLGRAVGHLRSGLLRTLLLGDLDLVQGVAEQLWGALPPSPVRVVSVQVAANRRDALTEWLELRVETRPGTLFFALLDDSVVLCVEADDRALVAEACSRFEAWAGISDPSGYDGLPGALAQSGQALDRAAEVQPGMVEFAAIARQGVLALLAGTDAREIGLAALAPLLAHDTEHGSGLVPTLRVWLEHNGQYGAVATLLGVHRHTIRARIGQIETLTGRDLSGFPARADLWAALLATDPGEAPQGRGSRSLDRDVFAK
ncbi:PucR family transcriptional regulator [Cryobacterium melibiosiphilum]|uniref:PucR family transcriptional regulator n=1 Tax=Cryobacterium melibiosiphilum TaxID=995039 RepID=A0A3A5MBN4_9MICO|nr:PucR family transcriptional regulator [Cryobacterium melibiosiphilum]